LEKRISPFKTKSPSRREGHDQLESKQEQTGEISEKTQEKAKDHWGGGSHKEISRSQ